MPLRLNGHNMAPLTSPFILLSGVERKGGGRNEWREKINGTEKNGESTCM